MVPLLEETSPVHASTMATIVGVVFALTVLETCCTEAVAALRKRVSGTGMCVMGLQNSSILSMKADTLSTTSLIPASPVTFRLLIAEEQIGHGRLDRITGSIQSAQYE